MKLFVKSISLFLVLVVLGMVGYTWFSLNWSYSEGERAGYIQKLSKKGWICKTWEGELAIVTMPGTIAEKFYFTVRDEKIANDLNQSLGKRIVLEYEEHVGIPTSCFSETGYFIVGSKDLPPTPRIE